ncbi:hypothetical protein F5144DRAFT_566867 [Chaetomium tenue]|uniref:Uncharacterized protein n=1 Tax=Chaetomium tenue TaxID=1854479 RepID=A0ACB7PAP2_9PEZI|nr:hypothetical protein F5144DRAFT_566867 [Chaetomium globosum]
MCLMWGGKVKGSCVFLSLGDLEVCRLWCLLFCLLMRGCGGERKRQIYMILGRNLSGARSPHLKGPASCGPMRSS